MESGAREGWERWNERRELPAGHSRSSMMTIGIARMNATIPKIGSMTKDIAIRNRTVPMAIAFCASVSTIEHSFYST